MVETVWTRKGFEFVYLIGASMSEEYEIPEDYIPPCDNAECRFWDHIYGDCVRSECVYQPDEEE